MKKNKRVWEKGWAVLLSCLMLLFMNCGTLAAAPADSVKADAAKADDTQVIAAKTDTVKAEAAKAGDTQEAAVKTDSVKADDTKVIAAKTDTAKANKGKPGQAKAGNAKKSGAKSGTAKYSVDAEEIEYDMESGDGTTTGKTVIKHDGGTAVGNAVVKKADKTLTAPRVDYHDDTKFAETMGGTARLEATDGSWVTAGKITYDMKEGLANATGGVKLESPPRKLTGSGDTAIYNTKETGYIDLIGNATAVQDGNTVKGDKLRITNTSPNHNRTHAEGNVQLVFAPKDENAQVNNPAFGEGAVLMANGRTNFNPAENIMDRVKKMNFDTEGKTA